MKPPHAFSELPADPAHRFRAVLEAVRAHLPGDLKDRPRLLDVGGFPCTFARAFHQAFPRWEAVTVDRPQEVMDGYVVGSGMELPFPDASFDVVVTIDTFEHIPAAERRRFVAELCRVSRGIVVLAAPFHHPATETVERLINATHDRLFQKPHPWLDEHVAFGLPRVQEAISAWSAPHQVVQIRHSYGLSAWTTWQACQLLAKVRGELDNAFAAFDAAASAGPIASTDEVAYRRIIISSAQGASNASAPIAEPPETAGAAAVELARFYARLLELTAADQQRAAREELPIAVDQRVKQALVAAEAEIDRLRQAGAPPPTRGFIRRVFG